MEVFKKNSREEKKLAKKIKRRYKRYWIGYLAVGVLFVLMGFHSYDLLVEAGPGEELISMILLMFGYNILYLIGVLAAIIVAVGGGRDQLMARLDEQVAISGDSIRISYKPKMREIENGDYAEYEIQPAQVKSLVYDERYCYLEIVSDCTYKVWAYHEMNPDGVVETSYKDKKIIIYDCFENMEGLKNAIQRVTEKEIAVKKSPMKF